MSDLRVMMMIHTQTQKVRSCSRGEDECGESLVMLIILEIRPRGRLGDSDLERGENVLLGKR